MLVSEIKKWAANKGYSVKTIKNVGYEWKKENSETKNFESDLEELAKKIYNDMTNNEFVAYQQEYAKKSQEISHPF